MSKANQKFVQADEAVSPVIGVILMVAITVVLAAVVFVLVSNLSKTSDKSEDVAFKADSYTITPVTGGIQITMVKMGTNGPYSANTEDSTTADDVIVNVDGVPCQFGPNPTAATNEYSSNFGSDGQWGSGETIRIQGPCDDADAPGAAFGSSTEHQVQVSVRGTLVFEGKVVIN